MVFQNVNGVPESAESSKQSQIHDWWGKEQVGIALLAETNRHWPSLPEGQRWNDRLRQSTKQGYYSSVACNVHQSRTSTDSSFQYGGCATSVLNDVAHAAKESGRDPSGLGRWSYVRLQGKRRQSPRPYAGSCSTNQQPLSHDLVVISAYRPNFPGTGESTVWAQHRAYYNSLDRLRVNPRTEFTADLSKAIRSWRDEGCEIILGVDANEDLSSQGPASFRHCLRQVGLEEAIIRRHGSRFMATHQRNSKDQPIDGLFVSAGVKVLAGGYYGFDEFFASDHRGLWLDFDLKQTLGGHLPVKSNFKPRHLTLHDSRAVRRYLRSVHEGYAHYEIPQRLRRIEALLKKNGATMTPRLIRTFNCIHAQVYMIRRKAEANCRKLAMGKVPWSPQMQEFWDRLSLWKILLKGRKKCRVSSRKVRRLLKKTHRPDAWKLDTASLEIRLKNERKEYKEAKKNSASQWRKDYIDVQVKSTKKKQWRSSKAREHYLRLRQMKQREEARRRRRARGKGSSGGLRAIQVEQVEGNHTVTRTIHDHHLVEEGCMRENRARYDQTRAPYCTPPMDDPLYQMFTGDDREEMSTALLEGRLAIPEDLDSAATKAFLSTCRFVKDHEVQRLHISRENHVSFWSKIPENKGSEPHGLHNGHFKAGAQSMIISECDAILRNIPVTTGTVPDQWKHLMNFAIEKKAGDFRLAKMRTIQLMNSEFQANNKLIGRGAMNYAEKRKLIPPGQCGSRKHHQAIDLAFSKRMVWDLLILQRRSAGWISNDAKSCFDRVVHWVAILALLRFGITWRAVAMMFDTMAQSTHRVRTGFGDSELSFRPPSNVPFQGCGQGNGAGPAIWVAVSSILIIMMEAAGFGFECLSALESKLVSAQCFCFVDDTDVIESASSVLSSGEDVSGSVQKAATLWAGGIRATGGAINPDKSFWWLIDFEWDSRAGTWKFRDNKSMLPDFQLHIPGLTGDLEPLPRLEPNHSERTLGVMLAPLENQQAQIAHLKAKAVEWAEELRPDNLHRYDVIPLIKTTIMKSLEYPMALTTFDEKTWLSILSPILQVCLPKAGICRSFPRAVVLAPLQLQGLGIPHPSGLQIFHHLEMLLRHSANKTKTNTYLDAVIQAHQLETGTSYGLLQQDYQNTAILTSETWLKRVWKELESVNAYVAFDTPVLTLQCERDSLLMELFMDAEVDQDVLKWTNWCRMYLQVCTVSDLLTADGKHIRRSVWEGKRDDTFASPYQWPRTIRPTSQHWQQWQLLLSSLLLSAHGYHHPLRQPLGRWSDDLGRWNWLYSPSMELLFHRQGTVWSSFTKASHPNSRRFVPSKKVWDELMPTDVLRASVRKFHSTSVLLTGRGESTPSIPPPAPSLRQAWQEATDRCSDFYGWVPDKLTIVGDESKLVTALLDGALRVISDGSYKDQVGTAAVQILAPSGPDKIVIKCMTPGRPEDQSAYRSELIGLLSGIMVVDWLFQQWSPAKRPSKPRVRIACDGLSALENCFLHKPANPTQPQFDLVSAVRSAVASSSATWAPRHVYGHLDKTTPRHLLSWWAKRNVEVDAWAGSYRKHLVRNGIVLAPNSRFFSESAALFIDNDKQSCLDGPRIQELVALPSLQERWRLKNTVSTEAESETDWHTLGRAMKSLQPGLQRWTSKHTVGMCGVGKFMVRWGLQESAGCPCCGQFEDHLHVPRCKSDSAHNEWQHRVSELSQWLVQQKTSPLIHQSLLALLQEVRGSLPLDPQTYPPALRPALRSQRLIGVQGLLEGRLSRKWIPLQRDHLHSIGSHRSSPLWAARLAQQLILLGFYMWEQRNAVKHSDKNVQAQRRSRIVNAGINSQLDMGVEGLPSEIRPMLRKDRQRILNKTLDEREAWLKLIRFERLAYRRVLAPQRRLLHRFLHPSHAT